MAKNLRNLERAWGRDNKHYWEAATTVDNVPPGIYTPGYSSNLGPMLECHTLKVDDLVQFKDAQTRKIYQEFEEFWTLKNTFTKYGFLHKRGYFLWGPPGSGKTSLVNLLMQHIIHKLGGIVLNVTGNIEIVPAVMQMIRRLEPDRPMIVLMEDLDSLVQKRENQYLAVLDGAAQVDNVVFIATSNYPENLDRRFTNRPSRFDRIENISMPSLMQRFYFIKNKAIGLTDIQVRKWAKETNGLSIAHLKELIVSVGCLNEDFNITLERLRKMDEKMPKSDEHNHRGEHGFISSASNEDDDEDWEEDDEWEAYTIHAQERLDNGSAD